MKEFHEAMVQPKIMYFFPNGNTVAYAEDGLQIVPLQRNGWLQLVISMIESHGFDPALCEFHLEGNRTAIPFKTEEGTWNINYK